jgi:DNA-binding NarL/FixJ family response regulator
MLMPNPIQAVDVDPERYESMRHCLLRLLCVARRLKRDKIAAEIAVALGQADLRTSLSMRLGNPSVTERQWELLVAVEEGWVKNGYPPTLQEVADQMGVSKVTVFEHVSVMVKRKLLFRSKHKARSLMVPGFRLENQLATEAEARIFARRELRVPNIKPAARRRAS